MVEDLHTKDAFLDQEEYEDLAFTVSKLKKENQALRKELDFIYDLHNKVKLSLQMLGTSPVQFFDKFIDKSRLNIIGIKERE